MDYEELKGKLRGIFVFPTTPYNDDATDVDEEGIRRNVRFLVDSGIKIVVPCGGTGEFFSLSVDEHDRIISAVADECKGKAMVIAGIGHSTHVAVKMAEHAESAGCDAVMVIPPSIHASDQGLYEHYKAIASSVSIGVMIFRVPWGAPLSMELVTKLADIDNIVAVKEETGDIEWFRKLLKAVGDKVVGICGVSEKVFPYYYMVGARGTSTGIAGFAPQLSLKMYDALVNNDFATVLDLHKKLMPLHDLRARHGNAIPVVKAALDMLGLRGGPVRLPLLPLSPEDRKELQKILVELGILEPAGQVKRGAEVTGGA